MLTEHSNGSSYHYEYEFILGRTREIHAVFTLLAHVSVSVRKKLLNTLYLLKALLNCSSC